VPAIGHPPAGPAGPAVTPDARSAGLPRRGRRGTPTAALGAGRRQRRKRRPAVGARARRSHDHDDRRTDPYPGGAGGGWVPTTEHPPAGPVSCALSPLRASTGRPALGHPHRVPVCAPAGPGGVASAEVGACARVSAGWVDREARPGGRRSGVRLESATGTAAVFAGYAGTGWRRLPRPRPRRVPGAAGSGSTAISISGVSVPGSAGLAASPESASPPDS
jgi:hypothetical protein